MGGMGATQNSLRGLQTSRTHLLIELHPRLGVSIQVPPLSFTSLHMRKPYSKPYSVWIFIVPNNYNDQLTLSYKLLTNIHHKQICDSNISCAIKNNDILFLVI